MALLILYRTDISHYEGSNQHTVNYSYDSKGALIELEIIDQLQDTTFGSARRLLLSYDYNNNNQALRSTQESFNAANNLTSRIFFDYSYDVQGRLESIAISNDNTIVNIPPSPAIAVRTDITYNASSLPVQARTLKQYQ